MQGPAIANLPITTLNSAMSSCRKPTNNHIKLCNCDETHSSHECNLHFFWAWALTVEKFKKANSLVGCQLLDWGRVNTELRESSWWFTDLTRTDRAEVAHWRQVSYGFCQKDDWPERSVWDVTEGSLPVVEIPTLRQDERGKDLLLCVTSELASQKNERHVNLLNVCFWIILHCKNR